MFEDASLCSFGRKSRQVSETAGGRHVTACCCAQGQNTKLCVFMSVCVLRSESVGVDVSVCMCHCSCYVDTLLQLPCAYCLLTNSPVLFSCAFQALIKHLEVMEHVGVAVRQTDGEPLKMSQSNHQLVEEVILLTLFCQFVNASPLHLTALQRFRHPLAAPFLKQAAWAVLPPYSAVSMSSLTHQCTRASQGLRNVSVAWRMRQGY